MGKLFHKNPDKYIHPLRIDHAHNIRNQNALRPPRFRSTLAQNSFLVQGPINYNNIPDHIKLIQSPFAFKRKLKEYFLSCY